MKTLKLIIILITIFACKMVNAHALWIETASIGEKNKNQEIKIYFGEYSHNLIEPVEKWYSDVRDFKLFVISPSQQKTEIKTSAHSNFYSASFIPKEDGIYTLAIEHPAKEVYEITAFEFTAIAEIQVGSKSNTNVDLALSIQIDPQEYRIGDIIHAQIMRKNVPFTNVEVEVVMPGGWVKSIKSDEKGQINFTAPIGGKYLLEVAETENKKTIWFDKSIEKIWRVNTAVLNVK